MKIYTVFFYFDNEVIIAIINAKSKKQVNKLIDSDLLLNKTCANSFKIIRFKPAKYAEIFYTTED